MQTRTIYEPDDEFWKDVKVLAQIKQISISQLIHELLAEQIGYYQPEIKVLKGIHEGNQVSQSKFPRVLAG